MYIYMKKKDFVAWLTSVLPLVSLLEFPNVLKQRIKYIPKKFPILSDCKILTDSSVQLGKQLETRYRLRYSQPRCSRTLPLQSDHMSRVDLPWASHMWLSKGNFSFKSQRFRILCIQTLKVSFPPVTSSGDEYHALMVVSCHRRKTDFILMNLLNIL